MNMTHDNLADLSTNVDVPAHTVGSDIWSNLETVKKTPTQIFCKIGVHEEESEWWDSNIGIFGLCAGCNAFLQQL